MTSSGNTLRPRRLLLVRPSHLGDVVCALPVFHALREALPDAELGWVVQPEFAGLITGLPGLQRVFTFERKRGASAWIKLRGSLRAFAPEVAVDAQGNLKSAGAMLASGAPRRIGLAKADWREPLGAIAINDFAPAAPPDAHAVERMVHLARHAAAAVSGAAIETSEPRTDPGLSESELSRGEDLARRHLPDGAPSPVIINLAAPSDVRSWPVSHYRRLAELLIADGRGALLLSGPGEAPIGVHLRDELGTRPGLRHWIGQRHLREASAFFAASARRGARFVSSDSGPMHLAAASGLAVVALCGPQDPKKTGPWPPPHEQPGSPHVVAAAPDPPPCAPCLSRRCEHRKGPVCMSDLQPEVVRDLLR